MRKATRGHTLIQLDDVSVALNGTRVLHNLNWQLKRGENWAVLGGNGAGKSTFLRLLRGEVWPAPVGGGTRTYFFDGEQTDSPIGVKQRMMLVSAELQQRYVRAHQRKYGDEFGPGLTARDIVFTGLLDSELVTRAATPAESRRVSAMMKRIGIADLAGAQFDKLSQGQLRKVLIARAVIGAPDVLILDEVGVGLDKASRLQLLDLIQQVGEAGTQILCTTHRRDELVPAISHVLELRAGRIVQAVGRGVFFGRAGKPASRARSAFGPIIGPAQRERAPFLIRVSNADVALEAGEKVVLREITWRMNRGEHWMILGDNGVGKSTLLKLILGELWPSADGRIDRFGRSAEGQNVWQVKQRIGYVSCDFQTRYAVDLPAAKVIASGFFASVGWLQPTTRAQDARVRAVIAQLGLQALAERSILEMSYGQARKVLVARALVNRPKLLILDEVFDGLDAQFRAELSELFVRIAARGTGLILVSHHERDMLPCITHRMTIQGGRIAKQEERQTRAAVAA